MSDLTWGGQIAVDHDDAFVHLEVPIDGGVSVITLEPGVARRVGQSIMVHADALLAKEVTSGD